MSNEFETKKFDIEEIARLTEEKDFANNPEAIKYIKTDNDKKTGRKNKNVKLIVIISVLAVLLVLVLFLILVFATSRNNVFYVAKPPAETENGVLVSSEEEEKEPEKEEEPEKEPEKEVCAYKNCVGNYIMESYSPDVGKCTYNVYVANINDDGKIIFSVALINYDSTVVYETGSITGNLEDNKVDFRWGDNHGNSGNGEIVLFGSYLTIHLTELQTSEGNVISLSTDTPITIKKQS